MTAARIRGDVTATPADQPRTPPPDPTPTPDPAAEGSRRPRPGARLGVRVRVLATVLVLTAIGMALTGSIALVAQLDQLRQHADATLKADVEEFRALAQRERGQYGDVSGLLRTALQLQLPSQGETFLAVVGPQQWVSGADRPVKLEQLPEVMAAVRATAPDAPVRIRQLDTAGAGPIRLAVVPARVTSDPRTGMLVIGYPLRTGQQQAWANARTYTLVSGACLGLVGVIGWLVAGRLLRPLRLLRDAAEHISHTDLALRIPVSGHDDVSELTRTVNAMLDRLQAAFETQQTFLDDAGHELRTPLTIVQGHLEVLDTADPGEVEDVRALVLDELDRMRRLVDDLIMLAKARRPGFLRPAPVDLDRMLEDVTDKAAALGPRRWQVDARPGVHVVADAQRLTQALLQLAANAAHHTGPGDEIGIGARLDPQDGLRLWVRDVGAGVRPEDADRIFERFGRAGEGRGDEGSGLGLSIVGAIAAAHGGRVTLDSEPGRGATFTLVLPTRLVAAAPSQVCPPPPRPHRRSRGESMSRILIAEDEPRISSFIEKGLRSAGLQPTVVADGPQAYDHAMSGSYDLLLLDLGLPRMDGFTVLRRLREARNAIPVVILTARGSVTDTVAGLEGGADDYMAKPFRFEELLARVRLRLRGDGHPPEPTVLRCGDLTLDLRTRRVTIGERTVDLSAREFALAEMFLRHTGQVLSREQLLSHVWGFDFDPGSNVVDVYVRYLRRKVGPERIETVRGIGYRLAAPAPGPRGESPVIPVS